MTHSLVVTIQKFTKECILPNIKKFNYDYECEIRNLLLLNQDGKCVYVKDSLGFNHKLLKGSLRRGCNVGFRSVLCEDRKDYFLAVHNSRYPSEHKNTCFNGFEYRGALEYTYVRCKIHNFTYRTKPNSMLNRGSHCKHCGLDSGNKTKYLTQTEYLKRSRDVHGERYNYDKTKYTSTRDYVTITCKEHGDFQCLAYIHLQGCGCQVCGTEKGGFSRSDYLEVCPNGSNVYLFKIKIGDSEFLKIGISKDVEDRVSRLRRSGLDGVEVLLYEYFPDATDAWNLEKVLHREFRGNSYTPSIKFKGFSECFDLRIQDEVIKLLKCAA